MDPNNTGHDLCSVGCRIHHLKERAGYIRSKEFLGLVQIYNIEVVGENKCWNDLIAPKTQG